MQQPTNPYPSHSHPPGPSPMAMAASPHAQAQAPTWLSDATPTHQTAPWNAPTTSLTGTKRPHPAKPSSPHHSVSDTHKRPRPYASSFSNTHHASPYTTTTSATTNMANLAAPATTTSAPNLSVKAHGKRPESGFPLNPHSGARKLVVKARRSTPPTTHEFSSIDHITSLTSSSIPASRKPEYCSRITRELHDALQSIFADSTPRLPYQRLYRLVEDLCRYEKPIDLLHFTGKSCATHLGGVVRRQIQVVMAEFGMDTSVNVLIAVLAQWDKWEAQARHIRTIFSYLDRSYLLPQHLPSIADMTNQTFGDMLFKPVDPGPGPANDVKPHSDAMLPGQYVVAGVCRLIYFGRCMPDKFDALLLRNAVNMLHTLAYHQTILEPAVLQESIQYFQTFAKETSATHDLRGYITACKTLMEEERMRFAEANFDTTTRQQLMRHIKEIVIQRHSEQLLQDGEVARLIDTKDVDSVKMLFGLLGLCNIELSLKKPWESYIKRTGAAIVMDVEHTDRMVVRLLELRNCLDTMVRDAFASHEQFAHNLRDSFAYVVNDPKIATASGKYQGVAKVGEMIAKHIDMLLRGGLKNLPPTLLSDAGRQAHAEKVGVTSATDDDVELDRQLDAALELFRFVEGKDVFEAFYKKDLARRLLLGRSASKDAERNMLTKLRSECGSAFTQNLEQMFKDQELSKDEMDAFKSYMQREGNASKSQVDLSVHVLSAAAWPAYPAVRVLLPPEVKVQIEHFDRYYASKHTGRQLSWRHNMSHCAIRAKFDRGHKELIVSGLQAAVLVLFNQVEDSVAHGGSGALSYAQISEGTGITGADLDRTLQSLACGKGRVLLKHPRGRDVSPTDTFIVNRAFTDPRYKVKINQIQQRETQDEVTATHRRVIVDRQFETQAAIVRIMKSRKTMPHAQLVNEVIEQTKSRGAVDTTDIKKNVEKLIEKEYLERDGSSYTYVS